MKRSKLELERKLEQLRALENNMSIHVGYIKSSPFFGNGLHDETRFRYHPWIDENIGHGNGMSNFMAYWGVTFFIFWFIVFFPFIWLGKLFTGSKKKRTK